MVYANFQIETFLSDLNFPVSKDLILNEAVKMGADEESLNELYNLPDYWFSDAEEIKEELSS